MENLCRKCKTREATDWRKQWCAPCRAAYQRTYRAAGRDSFLNARHGAPKRLALKRTLAEHIGNAEGRCAKCAWLPVAEGEWAALDFHHKDPATKLFAIGGGHSRRLEVLKAEAEKCIILCARCHRIGTVRGRTVRGVPRKHRAPRVKNPYGNIDRILGELL